MSGPLTVLLIDDQLPELILAEEIFANYAQTVRLQTSLSGREALAKLRDPAAPLPDVILLDWTMPDMGGAEVLAALRADERLRRVPVTVYSASNLPASAGIAALVKSPTLEGFQAQLAALITMWQSTRT